MATIMQRFSYNMKWGRVRSILAKLLGCFLLAVAALKVHGLIVDPYGQDNFLALPWLQVLTIEIELLLGLWLLSKLQPQWAWYATLLFFTILACFSFTLAYQGQASCGCFGKVEVSPWYTFALDVVIVAVMLLVSFRDHKSLRVYPVGTPPENEGRGVGGEGLPLSAANDIPLAPGGRGVRGEGENLASPLRPIFQILFTTTILLGILALGFTLITGDPWAALARLRGETLSVIPAVTQLGEGVAGEVRTFQVQLRNYSDRAIKVSGGTHSCTCITTQDLPIAIHAGGSKYINVTVKLSGSPGRFVHRFVLYSDFDARPTIARFSGYVIPHSTQSALTANATISSPSKN